MVEIQVHQLLQFLRRKPREEGMLRPRCRYSHPAGLHLRIGEFQSHLLLTANTFDKPEFQLVNGVLELEPPHLEK